MSASRVMFIIMHGMGTYEDRSPPTIDTPIVYSTNLAKISENTVANSLLIYGSLVVSMLTMTVHAWQYSVTLPSWSTH